MGVSLGMVPGPAELGVAAGPAVDAGHPVGVSR
jgi:hypothetical protein